MMMQILHAGGLEPVTDNVRVADASNSKGYYEHDAVKGLSNNDHRCLIKAEGRSIKVISSLLKFLPSDRQYKIIFMQRDMNEILKSQTKMLHALNKDTGSNSDDDMQLFYQKHLHAVRQWLSQQRNMDTLYVDYKGVLEAPDEHIEAINRFLNIRPQINAMTACVDKQMRHN